MNTETRKQETEKNAYRAHIRACRKQHHRSAWNLDNYMGLKPFRLTVNVPEALRGLIERRMKMERYHSISSYIVGLILFDLHARRPHVLTAPLMQLPPYVRDALIAELVADFEDTSKPGGWFQHRIEELVEKKKVEMEAEKTKPQTP